VEGWRARITAERGAERARGEARKRIRRNISDTESRRRDRPHHGFVRSPIPAGLSLLMMFSPRFSMWYRAARVLDMESTATRLSQNRNRCTLNKSIVGGVVRRVPSLPTSESMVMAAQGTPLRTACSGCSAPLPWGTGAVLQHANARACGVFSPKVVDRDFCG